MPPSLLLRGIRVLNDLSTPLLIRCVYDVWCVTCDIWCELRDVCVCACMCWVCVYRDLCVCEFVMWCVMRGFRFPNALSTPLSIRCVCDMWCVCLCVCMCLCACVCCLYCVLFVLCVVCVLCVCERERGTEIERVFKREKVCVYKQLFSRSLLIVATP